MIHPTLTTWFFIATLFGYVFIYFTKADKKIIFYFAHKGKPWAIRATARLLEELQQRKLKDKQKRKEKAIKLAIEFARANNGRRHYVMEVYDDFQIVDSANAKRWLRDNHFNSNIILSDKCVFYTPITLLTKNNK